MSTNDSRPPVARPDIPAPDSRNPVAPLRAQWTPARQRIFLAALLETGSVTRAAIAAGMTRSSAQRLRRRLSGTPFDRAWSQALAVHQGRMADPVGTQAPPASRRQPAAGTMQR